MQQTTRFLVLIGLVIGLSAAPHATAQIATLELRAVGSFADPHDITVPLNSLVTLELAIDAAQDLADWQANLRITGPGSPLGLGSDSSWWEQQPNVATNLFVDQGNGTSIAIGQTADAQAPWSRSTGVPVSLGVFEFTYQGPGDVVVQIEMDDPLLEPILSAADPVTGSPFTVDPFTVNALSPVMVTISQEGRTDWIFAASVAPGQENIGEVSAPDPGLYADGTVMEVLANATDPAYIFSRWTGTGVPGNALDPHLVFPIHSDVDLIANFNIPEPTTTALLALGLAGLASRRARRRRRRR